MCQWFRITLTVADRAYLAKEFSLIVTTRHGIFLATNTLDFEGLAGEDGKISKFPEFNIEVRSPSVLDLMGLMENFPDQCGDYSIQESICEEMPAFRFKINLEPEDWVNLLARLGAGITYKNFTIELKVLSGGGEVDTGVYTLVSNIRVLMMQIYSRMFGPFDSGSIH